MSYNITICIMVLPTGLNEDQGPIVLSAVQTFGESQSLPQRAHNFNILYGWREEKQVLTLSHSH